jgi:hypothetical protein
VRILEKLPIDIRRNIERDRKGVKQKRKSFGKCVVFVLQVTIRLCEKKAKKSEFLLTNPLLVAIFNRARKTNLASPLL